MLYHYYYFKSLQPFKKNNQYSRIGILHMIGACYISKQDKLMRKRKHTYETSMLRKPRPYWYEQKNKRLVAEDD